MNEVKKEKHLYIVLSQTGTILSRLLKLITSAEYNHASVSLTPDLEQMYSFGRLHPYNPFIGGFVKESPDTGTFKRFSNSKIMILKFDVSEKKYEEVCSTISKMYLQKESYHYNYLGLYLAAFRICRKKERCYYCSEFVKEIAVIGQVEGAERLSPIVKPIDFLSLAYTEHYRGILSDYNREADIHGDKRSKSCRKA